IYTMQQDGSMLEPLTNCSLTGLNEGEQIVKCDLKPNPVQDMMTINVKGIIGIKDIEIVSVIGQVIQTFGWTNNPNQIIDLSALSEGIYFCRIAGENTTVTSKFMIVR
ncbi:MAG: T9SS type A sorting domain-containing protein, partial [Bacteroidales bacterium]|nr:T9SS type A sorting domain-containing protein [Bacteroidales bacterium]